MAMKKTEESCGMCGMHLCQQCAIPNIIFGLLLIILGLGMYSANWFNLETIIGAYLGLWGLFSLLMKK